MLKTYKSQQEFLDAVAATLSAEPGSNEQRTALLAGLAKADSDLRASPQQSDSAALNLKVGSWIIRDQDVPIFAALNATAAAVIATLTTAGVAWPLIAIAVSALAEVCWCAWRRGARLSSAQVRVYGLLQARGPLSIQGLNQLLQESGEPMEPEVLKATLKSLTDIELSNGDLVSLAASDADTWRARRI